MITKLRSISKLTITAFLLLFLLPGQPCQHLYTQEQPAPTPTPTPVLSPTTAGTPHSPTGATLTSAAVVPSLVAPSGALTATSSPLEQFHSTMKKYEARMAEVVAQIETLDNYSPENFPGFKDLEITNQLVEILEFDKRKFELLIKHFNLIEDEILPFMLEFSEKHPQLTGEMVAKVKEFTGEGKQSVFKVQESINILALQMERMGKKIELVHTAAKDREIEEEKQRSADAKKNLDIASRIQRLKEEHTNYLQKIQEETNKLKELREKEKAQKNKIVEKNAEIEQLLEIAKSNPNQVKRDINRVLAKVREIRLNGLEIPRLNTTKTFIYLGESARTTLVEQAKNTAKEIASLEKLRRSELQYRAIRGVIIICVAILLVFILNRIAAKVSRKIIDKIEKSERVEAHRKQRYQTLSSVILSSIKILSWSLAILWILGELDIDYGPFLVAAGGISLAIGFGAQSLVKDVVTGFFILMEEQFALGDFVDIGGKTGTIEHISLRTVKIRALDGNLHIIPNGSISTVSNATHQWSRAVIKIGASYEADAEKVLAVLGSISHEMLEDPDWKEKLIDEPIPQGIISFGDSAVNFRVLAKTKPGEQWAVEREFQMRIKKAFDREGLEIPYNFVNIIDRTAHTGKQES